MAADKERRIANFKESKGTQNVNEADLPKDEGKYEEIKDTRESLAIFNHKKASVHYLEVANVISQK